MSDIHLFREKHHDYYHRKQSIPKHFDRPWGVGLADWASATKSQRKTAKGQLKAVESALQEQQPFTFDEADQALAVARPLMDAKAERVAATRQPSRVRKLLRPVVALLLSVALALTPGSAQARSYGRNGSHSSYGYGATIYDQPNRPYFGRLQTRYATAPAVPAFANQGNWYGDSGTWLNPISGTIGSLNQVAPTPLIVLNRYCANLAQMPADNPRAY